MSTRPELPVLVVKARGWACAVDLADVIETMRPLPVARLAGAPEHVSGVAVVRGAPVPVLDLGRLLGSAADVPATRFVTVRHRGRAIALSVDSVRGVARLEPARVDMLPAAHLGPRADMIDGVGVHNGTLLWVVRAGRLLSDEQWSAVGTSSG